MNSRRWSTTTKIIVVSVLAVIGIVLLVTFRQMIAPTIVALLLTFVLSYPLNWVQRRTGWARTTSLIAVYLIVAVTLLLLLVLIFPRLDTITTSLRNTLEDLVNSLRSTAGGPQLTVGPLSFSADAVFQQAGALLQPLLSVVTQDPLSIARGLTTGIVSIIYVFVLNFWLLKDWHKFQRALLERIPVDYREETRRLVNELSAVWQAFLHGQLLLGAAIGFVTWVCLIIVGMPNATGLALLAALMELLPSIGPIISGTIGTVLAFFQGSYWLPVTNLVFAIIVGVIYMVIGQLENVYFIPRYVGGRVKLHPAVTFVGIIAGAMAFGVLGILLAAPVIASGRVLVTYISRKLTDQEPFELETGIQPAIHIPGVISGRKIEAVIFDLDGTISQIDTRAIDWPAQRFHRIDRLLPADVRRMLARHLVISLEGPINYLANQLWRIDLHDYLNRLTPYLDLLRCNPPADQLTAMPEVGELLRRFAPIYRLALVSTRQREDVNHFLETARLNDGIFEAVIVRQDVRNILPHADALMKVAQEFNLAPNQILIVSDTDVGLRAGRAAEMATAGVTCGLGTPETLRDADLLLAGPQELANWL